MLIACSPLLESPATPVPELTDLSPSLGPAAEGTALHIDEQDPGSWKLIRHIHFDGPEPVFNRAAYWDDSHFYTVGRKRGIYQSVDGGITWRWAVEGYGTCGFGIEVVSPTILWSCAKGQNGGLDGGGWNISVRVSTDGGVTWRDTTRIPTEYTHASARCWDLSFLDDQTGWVSSFEQIFATQDGGQTWTGITSPTGGVIVSIYVLTKTDVFLLDDIGGLYFSQDWGESWSYHSLDLAEGLKVAGWDEGFGSGTGVLAFKDRLNGVVVVNLMDSKTGQIIEMVAMRTADGGQTWNAEKILEPYGTLYLKHDGSLLTLVPFGIEFEINEILVRQFQE